MDEATRERIERFAAAVRATPAIWPTQGGGYKEYDDLIVQDIMYQDTELLQSWSDIIRYGSPEAARAAFPRAMVADASLSVIAYAVNSQLEARAQQVSYEPVAPEDNRPHVIRMAEELRNGGVIFPSQSGERKRYDDLRIQDIMYQDTILLQIWEEMLSYENESEYFHDALPQTMVRDGSISVIRYAINTVLEGRTDRQELTFGAAAAGGANRLNGDTTLPKAAETGVSVSQLLRQRPELVELMTTMRETSYEQTDQHVPDVREDVKLARAA